MQNFTRKPALDLYPGIRVHKDTALEYDNENVHQHLENLVFRSRTTVKGEGYESTYDTTIHLEDGDILIFEDAGRGYIKPVEQMVTIREAMEDYANIQELG